MGSELVHWKYGEVTFMTEKKEGQRPELKPQDKLKASLLGGRLSPSEFIAQILELDRSIPTRDHAEENVRVLTDPAVLPMLEQDEDTAFELYNLLSLSHFHVGQRKLAVGNEQGKSDFEAALRAAEKITDEGYEQWRRYIQATMTYIDKDIPALERIAGEMEAGSNKNIVLNMIHGLQQYGNIDYRRDYRNTPPTTGNQ